MLTGKKRHGDTLVEVVIALGILTLILATSTTSALRAYRTADASRERDIAIYLAQSQVDALRSYRESMSWDDFMATGVEPDRITNKLYKWNDKNVAYPNLNGQNPNYLLDRDDHTSGDTPYLVSQTSANASSANGTFFMCNEYDTTGCTKPVGLVHGWFLSTKRVKKATVTNNDYYIYIVGQRANVDVNNSDTCKITDDIVRFDIRVRWKSRLAQTYQTASLVTYLANDDSAQLANKASCLP